MSSILKALKKLEEEKARKQGGSSDIARDILRSPHRRTPKMHGTMIMVVCLAAAIAGGTVYFSWREVVPETSTRIDRSPNPATRTGANANAAVPDDSMPVEVKNVPRPVSEPAVAELPVPKERRVMDQLPQPVKKPTGTAPRAVSSKAAANVVPVTEPLPAEPSLPRESREISSPQEKARPELVLSGIAFQADRKSRMAIVNDLPVMEGMRIEGYLIEEILKDRVRVSSGDRTFELTIEKGSQ